MGFNFKPEEHEEFLKERHTEYRDSFIYYPQACGEIKHFNCVWKFVCKLLTQKDSPGNTLLQASRWTTALADTCQKCLDVICCWEENAVSCTYPPETRIWYKTVAIFSTGIYEKHNTMIWQEVNSAGHAAEWGCRTLGLVCFVIQNNYVKLWIHVREIPRRRVVKAALQLLCADGAGKTSRPWNRNSR